MNENLIMAQLLKNVYFREKVLGNIKAEIFEETENEKLFEAISVLVNKEGVKKLDPATIKLRYNNADHIRFLMDETEDFPAENTTLLLKETESWARERALQMAVLESADVLNEGKDKAIIGQLIKEALALSFDKNIGLNYKKDIHKRFEYYNRVDEKIATEWDLLNVYTNGGLQKKTLTIGAGSSGLGKTLMGTNLTAGLIKNGYTGVYVTLELAEEFIARRIDSVVTRIPYYSLPHQEDKAYEEIMKKVKGNVFVREYKPSKASVANIYNFIRDVEATEKVVFDFVVVDYIQLMKPNFPQRNSNSYEKYKDIAEELREMAGEMNVPVISFSQVQRSGYGNSGMGLSHIADSIGIVNTSDLVIGMTQTLEEEEELLQTWRIIKNRLGRKGVEFRVQMDDELLAFNQVISEEERSVINAFQGRNINIAEPAKASMVRQVDNPMEEVKDYEKFIADNEVAEENLYRGFS